MNKAKNITYILQKAQRLFHGKRFDVHGIQINSKSGKPVQIEFISHPGSVVILPVLDVKRIAMIRNKRFAINEVLWELPAGTLEPHEKPLETAKRELTEETGYEAQRMEYLTEFFSSPGISNEIIYAYAAYDLNLKSKSLDDSEEIDVAIVDLSEALDMIKQGIISDAKTIITLLLYTHRS